jgi:hypothetical protein
MVEQTNFKTHHRLAFAVPKNQFLLKKQNGKVILETLNTELFNQLVEHLAKIELNSDIIKKFEAKKNNQVEGALQLEFELANQDLELFSFYRDSEARYIMDFWHSEDKISSANAAMSKPNKLQVLEPKSAIKKPVAPKTSKSTKKSKNLSKLEINPLKLAQATSKEEMGDYRDFRYGSSFIWNYEAIEPDLEQDINLTRKTPDYFYPIKDRAYSKDEKEAHVQLSINLFRKEKWGHLAKSIELYQTKYGNDSNRDFNDFLKACALLKKNLNEKNKSIMSSAINILQGLESRTNDFNLKMAAQRYSIQFYRDQKAHVKALQLAKKMFVDAKKEFNKDMITWSSKVILHTLAKLKQIDKIELFVNDIKNQDLIPAQLASAYIIYTHLKRSDLKQLITYYESIQKQLASPVHPAILYNTAEAYFRDSKYLEAISLYDQFIKEYSHISYADNARLRLATAYDITDKEPKLVRALYKEAIDRSSNPTISYEAKIRLVGIDVARKRMLGNQDLESLVYLKQNEQEKKGLTQNLKKLLWITRMRTMISQQKYSEALAYLSTIPLNSLKPEEKTVFWADGAEALFGHIKQLYLVQDYTSVVQMWELYKDTYENRVSKNPELTFTIADAYIQLGLYQSYQRVLAILKEQKQGIIRTFPNWVKRDFDQIDQMVDELELIRMIASADWEQANKIVKRIKQTDKVAYYQIKISFNQAKFNQVIQSFEGMVTGNESNKKLKLELMQEAISMYAEALYKTNQHQKFINISQAVIEDITGQANLAATRERLMYLLIESLHVQQKESKTIVNYAQKFLSDYKESSYRYRVTYLNALGLLAKGDEQKGQNLLKELVDGAEVPNLIKELARSELTSRVLLNQI